MKKIVRLLMSLFLLYLPACTDTGEIAPASMSEVRQSVTTTESQLVYTYLNHLVSKPLLANKKVEKDLLFTAMASFALSVQQGQIHWQQADQYQKWYENNLAQSCAFTFTDQQGSFTTVGWDYGSMMCHQKGEPQDGRCMLTVHQRRDTLHASFTYEDLQLNAKILNGHHQIVWKVQPDGQVQFMAEILSLNSF